MVYNPYGPVRFNHDPNDVDWIPAIPEPRRIDAREEPAGFTGHVVPIGSRDPVGVVDPIDDPAWRRKSPLIGFDDKTRALHWFFHACNASRYFPLTSSRYFPVQLSQISFRFRERAYW